MAESDHDSSPSVSVVVPVLDSPERIRACIEALLAQSYPSQQTELLIVDNGSQDGTRDVISSHPVTLIVEDRVRSPYAARNAGIEYSSGEILALTDANCVPATDWLERGVETLSEGVADLVGGRVEFIRGERSSVGEMADSLINVDVETSIASHRACMTGNLFAIREVVERVGPFESDLRSGGDMRWTRRATDAGFRLQYADRAVVSYPARHLAPLLVKQYRTGTGTPGVWAAFGMSRAQRFWATLRGLLPMPPGDVGRLIGRRGTPDMRAFSGRLWLAIWLCKLARAAGCLRGLVRGP